MKLKRIVSFVLFIGIIMSLTSVALSASEKISLDDWKSYYSTIDNTIINLTPGADESELNFSWHSSFTAQKPVVRISENEDMSDYDEFIGTTSVSDVIGQRVNRVTATGLEENTTYYYTYSSDGDDFSEPSVYITHSSDSFKFLFVSDQQPNSEKYDLAENSYKWNTVLEEAFNNNDDISFIVSAGDMTNSGDVKFEWTATLSPKYLRSYAMATVVGNHDNRGLIPTYSHYVNNPNTYLGLWPSIAGNGYWFRYGDVLFVMINSNKINSHDTYKLVDLAVDANPDAKWRIGVMHHDVYGTGGHASQESAAKIRALVVPAFEENDFDVILTGHDHIYGRSYFMDKGEIVRNDSYNSGVVTDPDGILYMTSFASSGNSRKPSEDHNYPWLGYVNESGNDGYSTIEITDDGEFIIKAFDSTAGEQIDEFKIIKTDFTFEEKDNGGYFYGALIPYLCEKYPFFAKILGK
ncbi:MAG: metallophosphoesterase family protein [Clostridia bacterium]|nr:metallophosphoesterase family protein [Clostridia bacterium]